MQANKIFVPLYRFFIGKNRLLLIFPLVFTLIGFGSSQHTRADTSAAGTSAQNIILFIADGMGPQQVRAGGMYVNGAEDTLSFESFPYETTMSHNASGGALTDSAASATAMATGFKVNNTVISQGSDGSPYTTLLEIYQAQGKSTGLVTTSYMLDATPAAFGAHSPSRYLPENIASDLLNDSRPNVLFGGGDTDFLTFDTIQAGYTTITNRFGLQGLSTETQTRVAGVFGFGEIPPLGAQNRDNTLPSLPEMTETALNILDNDPDGFFLVVEHEGSDTNAHANRRDETILSVAEMSSAVQKAIDWKANNPNTLILVTADHETGGMEVTEENPSAGSFPSISWGTTRHTTEPVPVYADGVGADQLTGQPIDNTDIFSILSPASSSGSNGVIDRFVADDIDDVEQLIEPGQSIYNFLNGNVYMNSSDLELVNDDDYHGGDQMVGIRFQNIGIPQGATITNAYIEFTVEEASEQGSTANITIRGEDVDNALEFKTDGFNVSNRTFTSASTSWNNIPEWTQNSKQQTPDISSIVQEIVDRGGWSSNNSIVFGFTGTGRRTAASSRDDVTRGPRLYIEFETDGGGTPTTLLSEDFSGGPGCFSFVNNAFRNTNQPTYALGGIGGFAQVSLGGRDNNDIDGMSGGWGCTFTLNAPSAVTVNLDYRLELTAQYESDEFGQALMSVDGVLYGLDGNDYLAQNAGGGVVGWDSAEITTPVLDAGTHTLIVGGYNNRKTFSNEVTTVQFDNIVVSALVEDEITECTQAVMGSPTPNTTLSGNTETFSWNDTGGQYSLAIFWGGSTSHVFELGTDTSFTFNEFPTDGSEITVRLGTFCEDTGFFDFDDYRYTALDYTFERSEITKPTPNSELTGDTVTFEWTPVNFTYRLDIGSSVGASDIHSKYQASALSDTVSGLPTDGSTVYVRLTTIGSGGVELYNDYTYTAAEVTVCSKSEIISPTPNSELSGGTQTFEWNDNGERYWVHVGSAQGRSDYENEYRNTNTLVTIDGLPTDGSEVWVRLWTYCSEWRRYQYNDYQFTAYNGATAGTLPYVEGFTATENFGSGSDEFSGMTLNRSNNRFVMVDDGRPNSGIPSKLYEFSINANFQPNTTLSTRNIDIAGDIEGVAWMYDNTYAIVSEANGVIYIIDLDDPDNATNITDDRHMISTGIALSDGDGVEGVAYEIGSSTAANPTTAVFYAVREKTPVIRKVDWNGQQIGNELALPVREGSDVYYAEENGSLYVVSDADRQNGVVIQPGVVTQFEANASFTSINEQSSMQLQNGFVQPEGITFTSDLSRMFIASETRGHGNNALSFGIFTPQ